MPWPWSLCCVLEQDTLLPQCLSPPKSINGYRQQNAGGNLRWTSIPSRGSSNTPSRLHAKETGISSGSVGQFDPNAALPYTVHIQGQWTLLPKSSSPFNFSSSDLTTVFLHKAPLFLKNVLLSFWCLRKPLNQEDHIVQVFKINLWGEKIIPFNSNILKTILKELQYMYVTIF